MLRTLFNTFAVILLLSACAAAPSLQTQMQTLGHHAQAHGNGQLLIVQVPAADNPISNGMIIASLESGSTSNAARQITELLGNNIAAIGIVGNSGTVNAATLKRALHDYPGQSRAVIYLLGQSGEANAALQQAAKTKGVTLIPIAQP
ncbi:hypothetical protein [Paralysiella testudinis]|uniref:Lipoprotein n=1 Tax=Paralysiella testudinis TaxID=2809020 RepID=A0A892ZGX7_9NEIS|nr:hypothetical protein [Paralysiella testudinis]QRQ82765.1 hypothetical protein JQU52_05115 [Paralysiella testudinis]